MATSDTLRNHVVTKLVDATGQLMSPDATYYVSLHTGNPVAATPAANELAASFAYARAPYTNGLAQWATVGVPTAGETTNAAAITFAAAAGGDWATATHFGIWNNVSSTSAAAFLFGAILTGAGAVTCTDGDAVQFQIGALTITCA
tara:strand:+ start:167 stop:604 length:438 start_codon:yes stop_codon:yes gene_type:complete